MKYSSLYFSDKYALNYRYTFQKNARLSGERKTSSFPCMRIKSLSRKIQFIPLTNICTGKDRVTTSHCMISKEVKINVNRVSF